MMKFKGRIVSLLTVLALVLTMMPTMAFSETEAGTAKVYVTISDEGNLVMSQKEVTVTDIDADGALTINDALYAAHETAYEGGAAAGYESAMSSWGLSIKKLWGDTSGAFGYYVNDVSAWSLTDSVADGDFVNAYIYKDQTAWSDSYSCFDKKIVEAEAGDAVELTLSYVGYDANWNKVSNPAANAKITMDGKSTDFVTDSNGKVVVSLEDAGTHVISAVSDSMILVPAVCLVTVAAAHAELTVTIADEGELVMIQEKVTVTDSDKDGELTINDALYAAHETAYEGGAAAGYESAMSSWGLSIIKLWGDTSGAFGYCVNDVPAMSLADSVNAGDAVYAYVYKDQNSWTDSYSYFDIKTVEVITGETVELTLSCIGYDSSWNKVTYPVAGAKITVDGMETDFITDSDGKAAVSFEKEGSYLVSAVSDSMILVPAVCLAKVTAVQPEEDNPNNDFVTEDDDDSVQEPEQEIMEEPDMESETVETEDGSLNGGGEESVTDEEQVIQESTIQEDVPAENNTATVYQTGDNFNVVMYGLAALAALVAAGFCLRRKTYK